MDKFCKDCKWAKPTAWWELPFWFDRYRFGKCFHPIASKIEIEYMEYFVSGKKRANEGLFLDIARNSHRCGKEGKYWEPRK